MKDYSFLVFIVLIKALVSSTEDFPPSVSCNMELSSWQDAGKHCISRGGHMFPYQTGLGGSIDKLHLKSEIDVWTADYLISLNIVYHSRRDKYCGFNYLNNTIYENIADSFYGDCDVNRNYFCINKTGNLVVYNNSRENIHCGYNISSTVLQSMRSAIKPGFYWNTGIEYRTARIASTDVGHINIADKLCGAYKSSIGMYYANCMEKRFSLCSSNGARPINNICFDGTKPTTIVTRTAHTTNGIKQNATLMTSRHQTIADISHTSSKQSMAVLTSVQEKTNIKNQHLQEEKQSSGIGIKVGVPLGIILPLTCGVLIFIYIYRKRIKCWQSGSPKHENGRMNPFHTQETSPVHGQLNVYSESIQETLKSSEHHTNENNLTDISALYGVVKKPKNGDTKFSKKNYSNKSYQNTTNDEYDVAERFRSYRSNLSDNLYNHFESADEYNLTSFVKEEGECNNMYNTTGDSSLVESDYDSTTQVNNTALPDDVLKVRTTMSLHQILEINDKTNLLNKPSVTEMYFN
ncbi:uncharacterized protein LOC132724625 [Ruditapes philippinarum]|uniref:uncharacterized protein LOC132724625 n=1 Tax=Ruditapes philippinarum TaxID=129788 RepID=UPI00295AB5AB|nr:uncharacterized protein LOC132724625 [Ruditapes philippinarum]